LDHYINPNKTLLTSIDQGIEFGKYIFDKKIWERKIIIQGDRFQKFGVEFKIISPNRNKLEKLLNEWKKKDPNLLTGGKKNDYSSTLHEYIIHDNFKEDTALPNGSSIAFILTYKDKNILFLGDSHPSVVIDGLRCFGITPDKPIQAEIVKLAHHGSRGNTNKELLNCIDSKKYIISTNGDKDQHPHKELLARLISSKKDCEIYFNYKERIDLIFTIQDRIEYSDFQSIVMDKEFDL
jgi:beta-lactamase superfamily II metal-dependent hydrolase